MSEMVDTDRETPMIVWGRKLVCRSTGRMAVCCPIRRVACPFQVWQYYRVFHVWWIAIGNESPVRTELRSESDDLVFPIHPDRTLNSVHIDDDRSLEELIEATNPHATHDEKLAFAIDVQAASAPEGSPERSACIEERFEALEHMYKVHSASGYSESITATIAFAAIATTAIALIARLMNEPWWTWLAAASAILWPILIYRMLISTKRAGWVKVEPHLVESLLAIQPTENEIRSAVSTLRRGQLGIAKAANAQSLSEKIQHADRH
jgi:hypothetical protein